MRRSDVRRVLELAADASEAPDRNAFANTLVTRIRELLAVPAAVFHDVGPDGDDVHLVGPAGVVPPGWMAELWQHADESAAARYFISTGRPGPVSESDFVSRRQWRRLTIGRMQRDVGAEDSLGVAFASGDRLLGFSVHDTWASFTTPKRELLALARTAVARAHAIVLERERARRVLEHVAAVAGAVVVVTDDGEVVFTSPAAQRLLDGKASVHERRIRTDDGLTTIVLEREAGDAHGLTRREREVLEFVRDGLTNAEIGDRLFVSTRTIERHLRNSYAKLDVHTRTAAIARAFPDANGR